MPNASAHLHGPDCRLKYTCAPESDKYRHLVVMAVQRPRNVRILTALPWFLCCKHCSLFRRTTFSFCACQHPPLACRGAGQFPAGQHIGLLLARKPHTRVCFLTRARPSPRVFAILADLLAPTILAPTLLACAGASRPPRPSSASPPNQPTNQPTTPHLPPPAVPFPCFPSSGGSRWWPVR